jgi:hypothetical protein
MTGITYHNRIYAALDVLLEHLESYVSIFIGQICFRSKPSDDSWTFDGLLRSMFLGYKYGFYLLSRVEHVKLP